MRSIGCAVVLIAACGSSESNTTSSVAACVLDDPAPVCSAPEQEIMASPESKGAVAIDAGIAYEVRTGNTLGYVHFTPAVSGRYTLYLSSEDVSHVCNVLVVRPLCESEIDTCDFVVARQYPMVGGEPYEIRIPPGAPVKLYIAGPVNPGPGPEITFTSGPPDGGTSGPRVVITFTASVESTDCRMDGTPVACRPNGLATPWEESMYLLPAGPHRFEVIAVDAAGNVSTATRSFTVVCNPPGTSDALALLHLDDGSGQQAANPLGAAGVLGASTAVEPSDPAWTSAGRFGGGLAFTGSEGDRVSWPAGLGTLSQFSLELWFLPTSATQPEQILTTGDGRLTIGAVATGNTTNPLQIATTLVLDDGTTQEVRTNIFSPSWHYLLVTLDATEVRVWSDNAQYEGLILGTVSGVSFDDITLGPSFSGRIDEVWISPTPITDLFAGWDRWCPLTFPYEL